MSGSLMVVGTGMMALGHMTPEAQRVVERADLVLFGVADPWAVSFLRSLNPNCESLPYPGDQSLRRATYREMVNRMLAPVRQGRRVAVVLYGHPAVFVDAAPKAVEQARAEGYSAQLLPAVSALDCLFADTGFDPGQRGCAIADATDLILHGRPFDATTPMVILQLGAIGNRGFVDLDAREHIRHGLAVLTEVLIEHFSLTHSVVLYEAAMVPTSAPRLTRLQLCKLPEAEVTELTTLLVPAEKAAAPRSRWIERLRAVGIRESGRVPALGQLANVGSQDAQERSEQ